MNTREVARKVYPIAASVTVGAFVFLWLTEKKR